VLAGGLRVLAAERQPWTATFGPERLGVASSRCLRLRQFTGISLRGWRRTTSGTSSLPIPRPSKSSSIATRERAFPSTGSTVTLTIARIGPAIPRTAQLLGDRAL
jgi:hypothetical protein